MRSVREKKQWIIVGLFLIILLAVQGFIQIDHGDDLVYAGIFHRQPLADFLYERYFKWSSRVVIEAVLIPLSGINEWVWRLLNIFMVILLAVNLGDLFGINGTHGRVAGERQREKNGQTAGERQREKNGQTAGERQREKNGRASGKRNRFSMGERDGILEAQMILFALFWSIPMESLSTAGWMATTTNYLWPLALGTIALRPLKKFLTEEKCRTWEYVLCPVCAIYAANMEQMCAILLGSYLVVGIYLYGIRRKKISGFYVGMCLLILAMLIFILMSPGNAARTLAETKTYFPEYSAISMSGRLAMGFVESVQYYLAGGGEQQVFVFALLAGILFLEALTQERETVENDQNAQEDKNEQEYKDAQEDKNEQEYKDVQEDKSGEPENVRRKEGMTKGTEGRTERRNRWLTIGMTGIPWAFYWLIGHLFRTLAHEGRITRGLRVIGVLGDNRSIAGVGDFTAGWVAFQIVVYLAVLGCVAGASYLLHGWTMETALQLLILAAGLASRVIVGFSPTIYASGDRTALFASAAILIVTTRNLQLWLRGKTPKWAVGVYAAYAVTLIGWNLFF